MQNMFKNVHSKRFLLTYLGLVALLLLFFLTMSQQQQSFDSSAEPDAMLTMFEPTLEIPQFLAHNADNSVFTNDALVGKWSFIFFTSADCYDCEAIIKVLANLKAGLANRAVQVVLVDNSGQQAAELLALGQAHDLQAQVITLSSAATDKNALPAFFTRSRAFAHQDLGYAVFLVNPKGKLTARFQAPFTSVLIRQSFIQIRSEYARNG
ncbi:redoxin domain-containing protein [Methylophaga sp.]|uniref:TlpA family protein disulfide reductase n=1 Tax=Methylophaga sp. TaxID=2024840 RepID=UPI00271F106C|nr:redoxin domain-containing protein [Methylophaga sp.]MDO8827652.1 redoxin domain-containing protein [Methylophaga sp.]